MSDASSAIVVAHPDDEVLWLSSMLRHVGRIIFCFGDVFEQPQRSRARRTAVAEFPLEGLQYIGLPESGVKLAVDWTNPRLTSTGIAIAESTARQRYENNFPQLTAALRRALTGVETVYTHNPWGEYGHAEHIQVCRAVSDLQESLGYSVWVSSYIGRKSLPLARALSLQIFWCVRKSLRPDRKLVRKIMRFYRHRGAWTWTIAHRWPSRETLYQLYTPQAGYENFPLTGEWMLNADRLRWWPPSLRGIYQRL